MSMIKGRWFRYAASAVFAASLFAAATPAHAEEEIIVEGRLFNPPTLQQFEDWTWSYGHFVHMERDHIYSGGDVIENIVVSTSPPSVEPEDIYSGIEAAMNALTMSWAAGILGAPQIFVTLNGASAAALGVATVVVATQYALENADLAADAVMDTVWGSNWETQREVLP